jgi:mono/diheme cytochrome c family protein
MKKHLAYIGLLSGLFGCNFASPDIASVPQNPTFARDILPIFENHCLLCHGSPSNFGAPRDFRLDVLEDTAEIRGAATMGSRALERIMDHSMPPAAAWGDGLGPNDKEAVQAWVEQGSQ